MEAKQKAKGSWGLRFFIVVLSLVLGVLLYWVLSFVEKDIGTIQGPDRAKTRRQFVSQQMDDNRDTLNAETQQLNRKIDTLKEQQRALNNSTNSLQTTINQLLSIQRQYIDKGQNFPAESIQTLQQSQSAFLENQNKDLQFNQEIGALILQRQEKEAALTKITDKIKILENDVNDEYRELMKKHRLKVAALKLSFLVPVFLLASFLFMKHRTGDYWPLVWTLFMTTFVKIAVIANEYFPERYFKYIAILVMIAIVLRILVYAIKLIVAPKKNLLIKQYQQYYDKHLCPVCTKPIKTGPLRYAGWKKKATVLAAPGVEPYAQQPYTCPSCGTTLYEKCTGCSGIRHALLPYCEHCGVQQED